MAERGLCHTVRQQDGSESPGGSPDLLGGHWLTPISPHIVYWDSGRTQMSEKVPTMHSLNLRGLGKLNNLAAMAYFVPLCFVHTDKTAHFTTAAIKVP